ncbi:MAG TPA: hypothetical protein VGM90_18400 [Kofleriaceae bacterium]
MVTLCALTACGSDPHDDFTGWTLPSLTKEEGISLRVPPFDVASGEEVQNCYFLPTPDLNNGQPYWINRIKMATNPGSHHLNVFRVKTIIGLDPAAGRPVDLGGDDASLPATLVEGKEEYATNPCWNSTNWADWPLIANDQESNPEDPYFEWDLPQDQTGNNVALKMVPGEMLMIQSHFVNSTDQATPFGARIGINFERDTTTAAPTEMGTLFATQQHIRICQSQPDVSFSGTCHLPSGPTITAANGHFHSRGKQIDIFNWDGLTTKPPAESQFYESTDWNEPPMSIGLDVPVPETGGVYWTCTYHWHAPSYSSCDEVNAKDPLQQNDCCYTFGGDTDIGEHCNIFVYYYPRGSSDVFCN